MPNTLKLLPTLLAAGALFGAVATAPASAATPIVHATPTVPLVVDGFPYAPEQIHRFDGRALYSYVPSNGQKLIAFTDLGRYKAFLRTKGVRLPAPGEKPKTAHASYAGQSALLCTDPVGTCGGPHYTVYSGNGITDLRSISGCNFFGCQFFANTLTRIDTYQYARVVIFDKTDFDPSGGALTLGGVPSATWPLTAFGWGNRVESVFVPW